MKLLFVLFGLCISAYSFSVEMRLSPGESRNVVLNGNNTVFRVRCRLALPKGREAWGGYYLGLKLNGKEISSAPINTGSIRNISRVPIIDQKQYSSEKQAWFIKADSNWIPFDCSREGSSFNKSAHLEHWNLAGDKNGYINAYYDKVFLLPDGKNELLIKNLSPRYAIICEIETGEWKKPFVFYNSSGEGVFPWSFPDLKKISRSLRIRVCPGEYEASVLAVKNISGSAQSLQWKISDFRSESGIVIPAAAADIRVQEYREIKDPKNVITTALAHISPDRKKVVPDRLTAARKLMLEEEESGALWILFSAPENSVPGKYRSELLINGTQKIVLNVEILPFKLAESERIYGLWTNSLPGRDPIRRKQQTEDLKKHGINHFLLDAWTVPVSISANGKADLTQFKNALEWLKTEKMNQKVLIYGLLDPLFRQIGKYCKTNDLADPKFQKVMIKTFCEMSDLADKNGFKLYIHAVDEPDVHPKRVRNFKIFYEAIRKNSKLRTFSNASPAGLKQWGHLIDYNLCGVGIIDAWQGKDYTSHFFPQWGACPAEFIRQNVKHVYGQVRSVLPHRSRLRYGFFCDYTGIRSMWGFAYWWGNNDWHVAYPFPEADGRYGTTVGWEMLHSGIQDSRYLLTLQRLGAEKKQTAKFRLPEFQRLLYSDIPDLEDLRNQIIDEILTYR